jgi:hypothetical protein
MQSGSGWDGAPVSAGEIDVNARARTVSTRKAAFARKLAAGFLIGASLMWGGLAWAGVPTGLPGSVGSAGVSSTVAVSKLYGELNNKVEAAAPDTKVRVIVHLKAQADLSRWPSDDRTGAIMQLKRVAAATQPQAINAIQAAGNVSVYQRYWVFNGFAIEAPVSVVRSMATRDDVDYIIEDQSFTAPVDKVCLL